jgi:hypothetical protein
MSDWSVMIFLRRRVMIFLRRPVWKIVAINDSGCVTTLCSAVINVKQVRRTRWRSHSVHIAVLVFTRKPSFDRIHYRHDDDGVFLYAFDLIELDGGPQGPQRHALAGDTRPVAAMVEGSSAALRGGTTGAGTLAIPQQKDCRQADDHPSVEPAVS